MIGSILLHGVLCAILYIVFLLIMKSISLMEVTGFRLFNYVILCLMGLYQINRWINQTGSYVPFLQVFFTVFFTGVLSFILFTVFLVIYSKYNIHMQELFVKKVSGAFTTVPFVVILLEGISMSTLIALINMQYFLKYEKKANKKDL